MTNEISNNKYHFDIHASIVFQLGESLISDVIQALVELVKNSYDADASYAKVTIDTEATNIPGSNFPMARGLIMIEDDGTGMDIATIIRGWLTISNSPKKDLKKQKGVTSKGRTPLGDKGLGRLGVQRLGDNVEIRTRPINSDVEYHVAFSWRDFSNALNLSEVPVTFKEVPAERYPGTTLIISDLKDPNDWKGNSFERLQSELSQMIFPYQTVRDFIATVIINGKSLDLVEITEKARQAAQSHYVFNFDGNILCVECYIKQSYLKPSTGKDLERRQQFYRQVIELETGKGFLEYLGKQKASKSLNLQYSDLQNWFVKMSTCIKLDDLDALQIVNRNSDFMLEEELAANPGPFRGEVDYFSLSQDDSQDIFNSHAEFRQLIKSLSGIRVYRDGFGIRVDRDWLKLSQQQTSATSFYGLRPENTLGYITISARNNSQLEEKTDREGFKVSPSYLNFYMLMQKVIKFAQDAQEHVRRSWNGYTTYNLEKSNDIPEKTSTEQIARTISTQIAKVKNQDSILEQVKTSLQETIETTKVLINESANKHESPSLINQPLLKLHTATAEAARTLGVIQASLLETAQIEDYGTILNNRIEAIQSQLTLLFEATALGLTAEAFTHEILNVLDQLALRNRRIANHLKMLKINDFELLSFVEYLTSTILGLRKQIAHITPALRYVREKRENVEFLKFLKEMQNYYQDKFKPNHISLQVSKSSSTNFIISMNKGKLIQIFDNLFLNSEYWLKEEMRRKKSNHGIITVEICKPQIRIYDTGKGIDEVVEETLFEPFVTTKASGRGRGLGLYIVSQLLNSEGCSIILLPERNSHGKRYIFEINFTGALSHD